jgi:hypothetical protein
MNYKLSSFIPFVLLTLTFIVGIQLLQFSVAEAVGEPTVQVNLQKKFSGPYPPNYTADMFSFKVRGPSFPEQNISLNHYTDDTANGSIHLPIGTYTLEEVGPVGFIEGQWRPGWYGGTECLAGTDFETTLTITGSSINRAVIDCGVDNQWRFGTLRVVKKFVGTTSPFENFEFKVTQGTNVQFDDNFDSDGDMEIVIGEGVYSVVETVHTGYTPSYSGDCNADGEGSMGFEDSQTCTITNTYVPPTYAQSSYYSQSSYGEGDPRKGTIIIEKQTNVNGDQTDFTFNPSWSATDFILSDNEQNNSGLLATGTYSVVETLPTNWTQTSAVCSDQSPIDAISLQASETVTCVIVNTFSTSTSYSQGSYGGGYSQGSYGGGGYSQGSYGGGGYSQGSYGGSSGSYSQGSYGGGGGGSSSGSKKKTAPTPAPRVLGDATSVLPLGAANTGAGSTSPIAPTLPSLCAILTATNKTIRTSKNG